MIRLHLVIIAIILVIPACGSDQNQATALRSADFTKLPFYMDAIKTGKNLALYEGLPHQFYEPTALKSEKTKHKTIEFIGYPFYAAPLTLTEADASELTAVMNDARSFNNWVGEKKCGGFHPDYALEWSSKPGPIRALICFGCWEVIFTLPNKSLRCDLPNDVRDKLRSILSPYRKNRPPLSPDPP